MPRRSSCGFGPPSADWVLIVHDLFGKPLHTFPDHALTRMISVNGVREKNGHAAANQERNDNRHDTNPCLLAAR
jgi:hypothetical protein